MAGKRRIVKVGIKCAALVLVLGCSLSQVQAQKIVTLSLNGGWCEKATGKGSDKVMVAASVDKVPANGNWNQGNIKTYSYRVGEYRDHGGEKDQQLKNLTLCRLSLQPGDSAEIIVALYVGADRGFFEHFARQFKAVGAGIAGALAGIYGTSIVSSAVKGGSSKAADAISRCFKGAASEYIGDARIQVFDDANNKLTYTISPKTNAADHGVASATGQTVEMKSDRCQYLIDLGVES